MTEGATPVPVKRRELAVRKSPMFLGVSFKESCRSLASRPDVGS